MNVSHPMAGRIVSPFMVPELVLFSSNPYASNVPLHSFAKNTACLSRDTFRNIAGDTKHENKTHRFPWRLLAFASDLGLLSAFLKFPALAILGWLIALPYYAYSIIHQPDKRSRKEEALYQLTANGIFPLVEAKFGIMGGKKLAGLSKSHTLLPKLNQATYKGAGGLVALLILTPAIGDRCSSKIVTQLQHTEKEVAQMPIVFI